MTQVTSLSLNRLYAVVMAMGMAVGTAQASGSFATYETQVTTMNSTLNTLVEDYAADGDVSDGIATLRDQWDDSEYYEAVEEYAKPIYPLIWQAIGDLENRVEKHASNSDVTIAADQVRSVLSQGLGAIRVASAEPTKANDGGEGETATVTAIQEALDSALSEYSRGETEEAKEMIQKAYMQRFEGIEGKLIALDPALVKRLEEDFNVTLPALMDQGNDAKVGKRVESMKDDLDTAETMLAKQKSKEVF